MATLTEKLSALLLSQEAPSIWCFAVPGSNSIVDTVNMETQKTHIYGKTLDEVRAGWPKYAQAELMTLDDFCTQKAARQNVPVAWAETTEEAYEEMLCCLPPACYASDGFLVGEPYDHDALTGQPRYCAYKTMRGKYFVSSRPMTVPAFRNALLP